MVHEVRQTVRNIRVNQLLKQKDMQSSIDWDLQYGEQQMTDKQFFLQVPELGFQDFQLYNFDSNFDPETYSDLSDDADMETVPLEILARQDSQPYAQSHQAESMQSIPDNGNLRPGDNALNYGSNLVPSSSLGLIQQTIETATQNQSKLSQMAPSVNQDDTLPSQQVLASQDQNFSLKSLRSSVEDSEDKDNKSLDPFQSIPQPEKGKPLKNSYEKKNSKSMDEISSPMQI